MRCALLPSRFSAKLVLLKKCWTMIFLYGPLSCSQLLYHMSCILSWNIVCPSPNRSHPFSFPLTNGHMCPPVSLFHGVIANTVANGHKKWGLHANFGGIVSPGNIHTKYNAVIIRVQTIQHPPLLVQGQRNSGMRRLNEMLWWCLELFLPDVIEAGDNTLPTGYLSPPS